MLFRPQRNPGWWLSFLKYFIPLLLATMGILALFTWLDNRYQIELLMSREVAKNVLLHQKMGRELVQAKADLQTLAQLPAILEWIEKPSQDTEERMVRAFSAFSRWHKEYDHVRFMNAKGMERIRVNLLNGKTAALSRDKLKYRGDRDFFIDAMRLEPGEVYISPMTLNLNRYPGEAIKPTVRISTPITDTRGNKIGVLVINMIAGEILSWLDQDAIKDSHSVVELLNADGYWLHSVDPKNEWAFMYGKEQSFARSFPADWSQIAAKDSGQFMSPQGLVTFYTIRMPVKAPASGTNYWKLVSRVTNKELGQLLWVHRKSFVMISVIILALMTLVSAGLATAIQRRKRAEETARQNELRFRSLFSEAYDGIFIISTDGKLIDVNESFARMHGYSVQEMLNMNINDLDTPETAQKIPERMRRVVAGESMTFEVEHFHKDGHVFPLEVSTSLISSSGEKYIQCIHRDITERKKTEQEMATVAKIGRLIGSTLEIDAVYEQFATEAKNLIPFDRLAVNLHSVHDENVKVAYTAGINIPGRHQGDMFPLKGSACEFLGKTRMGQFINSKNVEEINHPLLNLNPLVKEGMSSLLRVPLIYRDELIGSLHFRSKTPNMYTERDLRVAERIGAQIAGAIGSAKLFSEYKQGEIERRSLEERLRRSEKMEALGQLAGGVAHDLNNVLGILSGYSELLLMEIPEGSRSRRHVEKILQSTEKGAAIIQDLLTLARRGVIVSDVINLNMVVANFLKTPVFEKMKDYHPLVTFRAECDKKLLNIKGSPVHVEKTLMNLTSNAAEAISGEGEVTIKTENCYLERRIKGYDDIKEGDYVVLTISDTGMGIPDEDRERIFEPFYTKKKMGRSGTGLGLAVVWGTLKDHNGYIDLQTEAGKGTTFTLYFPVTREELVEAQQTVPLEKYRGKGESVLVVDDIADQREIASSLLTKLGYNVCEISSGEAAVEYLKENKVDIVVLDMIMAPGIDGLETYERVLEINPKQKAILVSGFSETERVREAQKLGAGGYVKKPYVMEKIGVAIRDELKR